MHKEFIAKNPTLVAILLFLVIFGTIHLGKPGYLYNNDGSVREFGIGYRNKTIFPVWLLSIVLGILCYVFILYYNAHSNMF